MIYELRIEKGMMIFTNYNKWNSGLLGHEYLRTLKIKEIIDIFDLNNEVIDEMPDRINNQKN